MKITIVLYDKHGLSSYAYIHDTNMEIHFPRIQLIKYKFEEWKDDFSHVDRHEFITLYFDCEVDDLSMDYILKTYPELLL